MKTQRERCRDTLIALVDSGLFKRHGDDGWYSAERPPRPKELPWFVSAVALLGRQHRHVATRPGLRPLEVEFRLREKL